MLKRSATAWLPIAVLAGILVIWAASPKRQRATAPAAGAVAQAPIAPEAVAPEAAPEPAGPLAATPAEPAKPPEPAPAAAAMTPWPASTAAETKGTEPPKAPEPALGGGQAQGDTATQYGEDAATNDEATEGQPSTDRPKSTYDGYGTDAGKPYGTDLDKKYGEPSGYGTRTATTPYGTTEPSTTTAEPQATRELARAFSLFDGFENGNAWANESASDHAALSLVQENASEGDHALKAAFKAFGKGNFELRREAGIDLTDATALRLDVFNETEPLDLTIGFRAGYDTTLFTSPPKPLEKGWNRGVTFSLRDMAPSGGGGRAYGPSWAWDRYNVSRVSLIFGERGQKEGSVYVDNLRFDRPATDLGLKVKPVIKEIVASATAVERFDPIELTVDFQADYQKLFDRAEIDLLATFFSPSGKRLDVHGFVYDTDEATGKPVWKIRFAPDEVGQWRYDVTVADAGGKAVSRTYGLLCQHKADRRGFVRVSKADPTCFEFDDGSPYYPLGQNVCWAADPAHYIEKIQACGGNYVRVWLCPWNLQLEEPKEPGKFDLRTARAIDGLLDLCQSRGIYVQLVLRYHGMHSDDWAKNPYNTANGGPCNWPGDFFTLAAAKDLHKRFLDYAVARWAHSPALFAWELWNEADLAKADRDGDLVDWHREMADYLKKIDPSRHLVTTSVSNPARGVDLFKLASIDFIPVHTYGRDVYKTIYDNYLRYRELRKPIFIGEFGGGHRPSDDLADTQGVHLHAGLWLAFVTPLGGSAMPWWWDTFVDKNNLYPHWAALARFASGVDRRGKSFEVIRGKVKVGEDTWASVQGLVAPSEAYLWVYDEGRIQRPDLNDRPLLTQDRPLKLQGMLGGTFRIEVWDTYQGKILSQTTARTDDGGLELTLPKCSRDVAVKVVKEGGESRPGIVW